jgi:hypothetical protein
LPARLHDLLDILARRGVTAEASTKYAGKTINLFQGGVPCGYINGSVIERGGVLGYRFTWSGRANDACPPEQAGEVAQIFRDRYQCGPEDFVVHPGTGANSGRAFLIITNPTLALRVLDRAAGRTPDDDIEIVKIGDRYIEGALRDVTLKRQERSSAARSACLAHYGYDCCACRTNLSRRYRGLTPQLIHVHHEEPLAATRGPREVHPIAEMKPVCPNCHAVIHSKNPPYTIAEVKEMLRAGGAPPGGEIPVY